MEPEATQKVCPWTLGFLTGPLYEEPKRVPKGVSVLLLFYHKHTLKRSRFMHQIRVTL